MFLFIFESIGTSELLLVGVVALIFLGPRKLPEMARKFGKIMSEFRSTTNEFKETWQREVNFEEEAKSLDLNAIEAEVMAAQVDVPTIDAAPAAPEIKAVDASAFRDLPRPEPEPATTPKPAEVDDKANWL